MADSATQATAAEPLTLEALAGRVEELERQVAYLFQVLARPIADGQRRLDLDAAEIRATAQYLGHQWQHATDYPRPAPKNLRWVPSGTPLCASASGGAEERRIGRRESVAIITLVASSAAACAPTQAIALRPPRASHNFVGWTRSISSDVMITNKVGLPSVPFGANAVDRRYHIAGLAAHFLNQALVDCSLDFRHRNPIFPRTIQFFEMGKQNRETNTESNPSHECRH